MLITTMFGDTVVAAMSSNETIGAAARDQAVPKLFSMCPCSTQTLVVVVLEMQVCLASWAASVDRACNV